MVNRHKNWGLMTGNESKLNVLKHQINLNLEKVIIILIHELLP